MAVRPLQAVNDDVIVSQREALETERGPQEVADQALESGAIAGWDDDAGVDIDPLGDGAKRWVAGPGSGRLVVVDSPCGLLPFAVAETEGDLDAADQRIGGFGRGRGHIRPDGQPAAVEHLRQPVGDSLGERSDLVQRWGRRGFEAKRAIGPFVPGSIGNEHVDVRVEVEAAAGSLEYGDAADVTARARSLPGHHGVVDQSHCRAQNRRPKGEQASNVVGQADDDLPIRNVREHAIQEVRRSVTHVTRSAGGAQQARLAAEREDRFVLAARTHQTGEARGGKPAREVGAKRALDEARERPAALLPAGAQELFQVPADDPVESAVFWQVPLVHSCRRTRARVSGGRGRSCHNSW